MKRTLVVGASSNPGRYSFLAVTRLAENGHDVIPLGIKNGSINGKEIITKRIDFQGIHTISLYIGPEKQAEYYDYIFSLKPKRIIFNPGTENEEFMKVAEQKGIEVAENCTLVMLSIGIF